MARRRFGGDLTAVAWGVTTVGETEDLVYLGRSLEGITAWDSPTDGTQVTDLLDLSNQPIEDGLISTDEDGMFTFYGPDTDPETTELWLDAGFGGRQLIVASDLGPEVVDNTSRIAALESTFDDLDVAELESELESLGGTVSGLQSTVTSQGNTLSSLSGTVSSLSSTVSSLNSTVSGFSSALTSLGNRITALENATLVARKPTGESVSGTTLQNDDDLVLTLAENATYEVGGVLRVLGNTSTDIKIQFGAPPNATVSMAIHGLRATGENNADDILYLYTTDDEAVFGTTNNETRAIHFHGMVRTTSGNGGAFRLRWAKYDSSGSLTMNQNSFMYARRLV